MNSTTQKNKMNNDFISTAKNVPSAQADKEVREFVGMVLRGLSESKKANKPLFVLPNWKFNSNKSADNFSMVAIALLEKVTKEKFHVCRLDTGYEGHLCMVIAHGVTEQEFLKTLEEL